MFAAAACCMFSSGCMSSASTKGGMYAKVPEPQTENYKLVYEHSPERIEASASVVKVLFWTFGDNAPKMLQNKDGGLISSVVGPNIIVSSQNAALYNACQQSKSDALLGTTYEISTESYGFFYKKATCVAKGFPAKIVDLKKVD